MDLVLKKSLKRSLAVRMREDGWFDDVHVTPYGIVFDTTPGHFDIGAGRFMLDDRGHLFSLDMGWAEAVDVSSGSPAVILANLVRKLESL